MSKKSPRIAELIASCQGQALDAHYLGYFECFNRGLYYEAHDVLEELWLGCRGGPRDAFYKGLIQLAGAFVHLQKHTVLRPRLRPSAALFQLARANLVRYAPRHEHLELGPVLGLVEEWLARLEAGRFERNPLEDAAPPRLDLPRA